MHNIRMIYTLYIRELGTILSKSASSLRFSLCSRLPDLTRVSVLKQMGNKHEALCIICLGLHGVRALLSELAIKLNSSWDHFICNN